MDDLVAQEPVVVTTRFELAAARIADTWLGTRRVRVSRADFRITREFLEHDGWRVEEVPGVRVRLIHHRLSSEMSREAAVMVALRRLVAPGDGRELALQSAHARRAPAPCPAPLPLEALLEVSARARTDADACLAGSPA